MTPLALILYSRTRTHLHTRLTRYKVTYVSHLNIRSRGLSLAPNLADTLSNSPVPVFIYGPFILQTVEVFFTKLIVWKDSNNDILY